MSLDRLDETQWHVHRAIIDTLQAINEQRQPFRRMEVSPLVAPRVDPNDPRKHVVRAVGRDSVVAGLMSKAARTQLAVAALVRAGLGIDAYALVRVLFENVVTLSWLLCPNRQLSNDRIDTYTLHFEAFKVRLDEVIAIYTKKRGEAATSVADTRAHEIAKEAFENRWTHWAWMPNGQQTKKSLVRLRDMAREIGAEEAYDLGYFKMSCFVHSAPSSVWDAMIDAPHVQVDTSSPEIFGTMAVTTSNAAMLLLVSRVNEYFDLGLDERVAAIHALLNRASMARRS